MTLQRTIFKILTTNDTLRRVVDRVRNFSFPGSEVYWECRYKQNGNSGVGSYGDNAVYKAKVLNHFVFENKITKVIELGCGDGNQLKQFHFPEYIGFDVSPTAIKLCKSIFNMDRTKSFFPYDGNKIAPVVADLKPELALSLDVIYHLVEDQVYEGYMHHLFSASSRYVIIYAWDVEEGKRYHVRQRNFSKWITNNIPGFYLKDRIANPSYCDFFVYEKLNQQY